MRALDWLNEWSGRDHPWWVPAIVGVAIAVLVMLAVVALDEPTDCERRGGHMINVAPNKRGGNYLCLNEDGDAL